MVSMMPRPDLLRRSMDSSTSKCCILSTTSCLPEPFSLSLYPLSLSPSSISPDPSRETQTSKKSALFHGRVATSAEEGQLLIDRCVCVARMKSLPPVCDDLSHPIHPSQGSREGHHLIQRRLHLLPNLCGPTDRSSLCQAGRSGRDNACISMDEGIYKQAHTRKHAGRPSRRFNFP